MSLEDLNAILTLTLIISTFSSAYFIANLIDLKKELDQELVNWSTEVEGFKLSTDRSWDALVHLQTGFEESPLRRRSYPVGVSVNRHARAALQDLPGHQEGQGLLEYLVLMVNQVVTITRVSRQLLVPHELEVASGVQQDWEKMVGPVNEVMPLGPVSMLDIVPVLLGAVGQFHMNLTDPFPLIHDFNTTFQPKSKILWISDLVMTNPRDKNNEHDVLYSMSIWNGWLKVMLIAIAFLNLIFNFAWFICIVINYLLKLEAEGTLIDDIDKQFGEIIWEILGHQCIDSLLAIQAIYLLGLSLDRYMNLFVDYSPYLNGCCEMLMIFAVPFLLGIVLFDHRWAELLVPRASAVFARLCTLLLPHLLSFVLLLVSSLRPPPIFDYEPRMASSLAKSLPVVLFIVVTTDLFARIGIFFELLELNYGFIIVIGSEPADYYLGEMFKCWYQLSHILIHCFPLYFAVSMLIFVRHYRQLFARILPGCCCGGKSEKVDYSSETIRSIMAEQRKRRMLQTSMH
ncbi:unnamed protein product, partial [Mesorhabditis spiculigera]